MAMLVPFGVVSTAAHFDCRTVRSELQGVDGETTETLLDAHPLLTEEGIRAALGFAVQAPRADVVNPVELIPK
jgi:hypothetical protein